MSSITEHARIKPLITDTKFTIIGYVLLVGGIIGVFLKWKDFHDFFFEKESLLNWKFFILLIVVIISFVWFIMNHYWKQEYDAHELTKKDRDNLIEQLKISENERLTDVVTGIPNSRSLENDIKGYFFG